MRAAPVIHQTIGITIYKAALARPHHLLRTRVYIGGGLHSLPDYLPTMKCVDEMPSIVPMRAANGDIVANITYWGAL